MAGRFAQRFARLLALAAAALVIGPALPPAAPTALADDDRRSHTSFFVSPNGDDRSPGTEDRPVRTLARAQQLVRRVNQDMRGDVVVDLAGGTYHLSQPLTFGPADSGTNG